MTGKAVSASVIARHVLADLDPANRLLADYLERPERVSDLFAHLPADIPVLAGQIRARADRGQLSAVLVEYQQRLGADNHAIENARLLADPATPVITVGQQPGLLTGPLYTPYKAITAINIARRLSRQLGRSVVPVFWVGADDDDRAEVDHCGCWDRQGALQSIRYSQAGGSQGQLVGDLPLECYGEQVVEQVAAALTGMQFADEILHLLNDTLKASADFGEWFSRLMSHLFSSMGLVLCDPRLPQVRRLAAEVLRREISEPLRTTELVDKQARELHRRGYPPLLTKPGGVCNFFLTDKRRQRVTFSGKQFRVEQQSYTPDDLLALLAEEPERFVPNAVLRPVVQEYLFGSTVFVAGPNELCYWAELLPVFQVLDVPMPAVTPRAAATLVPEFSARLLREWEIDPLSMLLDYDQTRLQRLEQETPPQVRQTFEQGREMIEQIAAGLVRAVSQVDATLAQSALSAHQRMLNEVERLERKTFKAVERQSAENTARFERLQHTLFPDHGLQERALNICCVLARYGTELLQILPSLLDGQEGKHIFVELQ